MNSSSFWQYAKSNKRTLDDMSVLATTVTMVIIAMIVYYVASDYTVYMCASFVALAFLVSTLIYIVRLFTDWQRFRGIRPER